ncbi:hypothetical protein E4U28_004429 [Claviceps purpurea]|nr:hypothetical protein E4U28_004429 [Claviceps purpurea]
MRRGGNHIRYSAFASRTVRPCGEDATTPSSNWKWFQLEMGTDQDASRACLASAALVECSTAKKGMRKAFFHPQSTLLNCSSSALRCQRFTDASTLCRSISHARRLRKKILTHLSKF